MAKSDPTVTRNGFTYGRDTIKRKKLGGVELEERFVKTFEYLQVTTDDVTPEFFARLTEDFDGDAVRAAEILQTCLKLDYSSKVMAPIESQHRLPEKVSGCVRLLNDRAMDLAKSGKTKEFESLVKAMKTCKTIADYHQLIRSTSANPSK